MSISLAVKYRPTCWEDVVEQDEIKKILKHQLDTQEIRNAYLFVGGAGTGKTTCARIFANEMGGEIIEIDGASNNGVDQIREISEQARTTSSLGKYKIFIIDECHMITIQGWNAMLKLIEEPPANTIFIFCTTNPEKILPTIMSRVQRFDFHRINWVKIKEQLIHILNEENKDGCKYTWEDNAVEYIAKLADGHMRDAITTLDKCLAYDSILNYNMVIEALGISSFDEMLELMLYVTNSEDDGVIYTVEKVYEMGVDLRVFIGDCIKFALDYSKWKIMGNMEYCSCPSFCEEWFLKDCNISSDVLSHYLSTLLNISDVLKYDSTPKITCEAMLLLESDFIRRMRKEN